MPISSGFERHFPAVRAKNNNLSRTVRNSSDVRYRYLGGLRGGGNPLRSIRRSCKDQFVVVSAGENFRHVGVARDETGLNADGEREESVSKVAETFDARQMCARSAASPSETSAIAVARPRSFAPSETRGSGN